MLRKLRKLTVVFTVLLLAAAMLSGFSANAKEGNKQEKLVVGSIGWDGVDVNEATFPETDFSDDGIGGYIYTLTSFALGFQDEEGKVRPVPLTEAEKFVLLDKNKKEVDRDKYMFGGLVYLDENRETKAVNVDGLFNLLVNELGTYYLVYRPDQADETQMSLQVEVIKPPIAVYLPDGTLMDPNNKYDGGSEFYLLLDNIVRDNSRMEVEITDIGCDEDRVDITEIESGYKIWIPEGVDTEFIVDYDYVIHYAFKNGNEWDENEFYGSGYTSFSPGETAISADKWKKTGNKWYYLDDKGSREKNAYRDGWYLGGDGSWDGKARAAGWKRNTKGWWYDLGGGKYLKNGWFKIDGVWYYFKADGYAAQSEWVNGYWLSSDCKWKYKARGRWHKNSKGWWYGDTSGWYAKNETVKIDGVDYLFSEEGYLMVVGFH